MSGSHQLGTLHGCFHLIVERASKGDDHAFVRLHCKIAHTLDHLEHLCDLDERIDAAYQGPDVVGDGAAQVIGLSRLVNNDETRVYGDDKQRL